MKAVFLGYPKGIKGYRLWSLDEKKVVINRDVVFNENMFYRTKLQVQEKPRNKLHRIGNFQFEVENASKDEVSDGNCDDLQGANLENDQLRTDEEIANGTEDTDYINTELNDQVASDDDEDDDGQNLRHYMLAKDIPPIMLMLTSLPMPQTLVTQLSQMNQ